MTDFYQTTDMGAAIRQMMERNWSSLVFKKYFNIKRIYLRLKVLEGLDLAIGRPWDSFYPQTLANWRGQGGLLQYHHDKRFPVPPETDAVIFPEAPQGYLELMAFAKSARQEVILYRPPDWSLHEYNIAFNYPESPLLVSVTETIRAFQDRPMTERFSAILDQHFAQYEGELILFEPAEIEALLGVPEIQLKRLMVRTKGIATSSTLMYAVTPMVRPDDPDLALVYDELEGLPAISRGERILRGLMLPSKEPGLYRSLKQLIKKKYVRVAAKVYVTRAARLRPDYELADAKAIVARNNLRKMTDLIDTLPEYVK